MGKQLSDEELAAIAAQIPHDCGCPQCEGVVCGMEPDDEHDDWWPCPNPNCPLKEIQAT